MILTALCGSTAFSALPPEALAGPMSVSPPSAVSLNLPTTEVHYYRRHWRHRHWGYWRPYRHHWGYYRPYYRHWGYYRPYRHWGYYRPYYRRAYYRYPYYGYGYNPAGALFATAALGLMGAGIAAATAPRWGWGGWGGWGWGPGWGWGGWW
ncbi:hypothetical protein [Methylocystis sp. S23]